MLSILKDPIFFFTKDAVTLLVYQGTQIPPKGGLTQFFFCQSLHSGTQG